MRGDQGDDFQGDQGCIDPLPGDVAKKQTCTIYVIRHACVQAQTRTCAHIMHTCARNMHMLIFVGDIACAIATRIARDVSVSHTRIQLVREHYHAYSLYTPVHRTRTYTSALHALETCMRRCMHTHAHASDCRLYICKCASVPTHIHACMCVLALTCCYAS